jgi:hypothetical protein
MALLDNLFSRGASGKAAVHDSGPANLTAEDDHAPDHKSQRMERRELLYAVVRESMARVGILSSSYKYKVLSLDSRGSQYLIMMDLPQEMAAHVGHLAEIEEVVKQTAKTRHQIDVSAVYWRINDTVKTPVLRKPKPDSELGSPKPTLRPDPGSVTQGRHPAPAAAGSGRRFEPIRPDEVHAFKQALSTTGKKPAAPAPRGKASPTDFAPTEFRTTDFEDTKLNEEVERTPLSRTQYGDLI